jgi:carbamoyl-phosphate synthase large subunit
MFKQGIFLMTNILLTSVGRRTYMIEYFKKALNGMGLVHASNSILTYSLTQADRYIVSPQIYEDNYINFLLKYCIENNIKAVISLFDIDLPILAENINIFNNAKIKIIVSNIKTIQICNDKWLTYKFLKKIGIKHAKTYINLSNVKNSLENGHINFPLILKPRWGMGSIGIFQADDYDELSVLYKKLEKDIFQTYLKYESNIDRNHCIVIQSKIIGKEYGMDILNDLNGNYVTTIAKRKIAMRAGETDIAEIVDKSLFEPVGKILSKNLNHIANLDVDCFITETNEMCVLEMNCRFGGQYPFSHIAGVDFPTQIINWINGLPTKECFITPNVGTIGCKDLKLTILPPPPPPPPSPPDRI